MSIGSSGRVVIEVDPDLKRALYVTLTRNGLTLKDWFVKSAEVYLNSTTQMTLGLEQRHEKVIANETV